MSPDEMFVLIVCLVISAAAWIKWYWELSAVAPLASFSGRSLLAFTPLVAAMILFGILKCFASHDVRDAPQYLGFYMVMGAAWVGLTRSVLPIFGLSARDDVIERKNRSAAYAVSGALLGITLCFAGGNIGDGPGWWVVVFAAALATATFFALWLILHSLTGLAETITIERDPAAGVRLGGFFIGIGLILGRAVAGNWVSAEATVLDFLKTAWPVVVVLFVAVMLEKAFKPRTDRSSGELITQGTVPAAIYIFIGVIVLILRGRWT